MRFLSYIAVALLAATSTVDSALVQHEALKSIPHGWDLHSDTVHENKHLTYRIAVKQNVEGLDAVKQYMLQHSANPHSPYFGVHKTRAEINAMTAPHKHSVQAVVEWLGEHGISSDMLTHSENSDFISFSAPVSVGERLLNTKYNVYQHSSKKYHTVRTTEYHVPEHIQQHIDFVTPTTRFPAVRNNERQHLLHSVDANGALKPMEMTQHKRKHLNRILATQTTTDSAQLAVTPVAGVNYTACAYTITPECIREIYGFVNYIPQATDVNGLGINGFIGEVFNVQFLHDAVGNLSAPYYADNATLLNELENDMPYVTGAFGDPQDTPTAGEADLDIQLAVQLTFPTNVTFFSTPGVQPYYNNNTASGPDAADDNEPYSDWLATVLNNPNIPQVISTSYGEAEDTVGYNYAQRVCDEFAELTAQGVTLLFGSGDTGVSGYGGIGDCYNFSDQFEAFFPAACPWVTAVGATRILYNGSEVAAIEDRIDYLSGGGFSRYFSQPDYQKNSTAVQNYIASLTPEIVSLTNPSGRGFPDVAAIGQNLSVYLQGSGNYTANGTYTYTEFYDYHVAGTSVATPIFASIIALINDMRLAAGKTVLGFLNPALYASNGQGLRDVTLGRNYGCGPDGYSGFNTSVGWDAVTGFGTPDFKLLSDYLFSLGNINATYGATPFPAGAFTNTPTSPAPSTATPNTSIPTTAVGTKQVVITGNTTNTTATPPVVTTAPATTVAATVVPTTAVPSQVSSNITVPIVVVNTTETVTTVPTTVPAATTATTQTVVIQTAAPVAVQQSNNTVALGDLLNNSTISVANTAVCNVIDPTRAEAPWHNSTQAYPQVYDMNTYVCVNGNFLCPTAEPLVCGTLFGGQGCYSSTQYSCADGTLVSV